MLKTISSISEGVSSLSFQQNTLFFFGARQYAKTHEPSLRKVDRSGARDERNPEIFGLQDCKNDEYLKHKENEVLKPFNKMLIMLCFDYEKVF